jgi:hypothetical protein
LELELHAAEILTPTVFCEINDIEVRDTVSGRQDGVEENAATAMLPQL